MGQPMPLTQGRIVGYDDERQAFRFTMLNANETIFLSDQRRRNGRTCRNKRLAAHG